MIYPPGLAAAANQTSSPFSQCKQYVADFEAAGATYNVSAFLLAAFALQESSCKADAVADAGTYGLMQLSQVSRAFAVTSLHSAVHRSITLVFTSSQDKCVNVDCLDPKVNIKIGAAFLKQLMDSVRFLYSLRSSYVIPRVRLYGPGGFCLVTTIFNHLSPLNAAHRLYLSFLLITGIRRNRVQLKDK